MFFGRLIKTRKGLAVFVDCLMGLVIFDQDYKKNGAYLTNGVDNTYWFFQVAVVCVLTTQAKGSLKATPSLPSLVSSPSPG